MKNSKFLSLTFFTFLLFTQNLQAQNNTIVKYYDSSWMSTTKDSSVYYTRFVKNDGVYNTYSYWTKSNKLNCVSTYTDTLFTKAIGLQRRYYENGKLQDSTFFHDNGNLKNNYHYYPTGMLWAHYTLNKTGAVETAEGFDEQGKVIPNLFMKEKLPFRVGMKAG